MAKFARYSRNYRVNVRVLVEEEKKLIVSEIAGEIDEAGDMMRKMELEARSMTSDVIDKVIEKLGEYRNELKKLKSEVARLRESNANQATRPALLRSGDIRPVQVRKGVNKVDRSKKSSSGMSKGMN